MPMQTRLDAPGTLHHVIVRGIEKNISELDRYRWCGHGVLMDRIKHEWQNRIMFCRGLARKRGRPRKVIVNMFRRALPRGDVRNGIVR